MQLIFPSVLLLLSSLIFAEDWDLTRDEIVEIAQSRQAKGRLEDITLLQRAKFALINGHVEKTILLLQRQNHKNSPVEILAKRYLAIAYFVKGEYEKSLDYLKDKRLGFTNHYPQICLMRVINLLALSKIKEAESEYNVCNPMTMIYSPSGHLWTDYMMELANIHTKTLEKTSLKTTPLKSIEIVRTSDEMIRTWLKMGIFLNKENELIDEFKNIPEDSYRSQKVRELMGFIYYRVGNNEKAFSFIEDIQTANAENIKGNINLEKKEFELAFGHFKLALRHKENSTNAIERAIPLSWLLEQWEDGVELVTKLRDSKVDERNKLTLDTAFQIRLKHFERAERQLKTLRELFNNKPPREIIQMESFIATMLSRKNSIERYTTEACRKQDGLNCYILMQTLIWDDLGKLAMRPERTYPENDLSIQELKTKAESNPIKDDLIVDQRDIEELDDAELGIRVK